MRGGAVVGTTGPTGHALLLDCRFEPPFDAEGTGGADLQRKLDLLNGALDAERAEQARRQLQYVAHSGYSEDSDYTSDLNFPVGQHPNCSASQFRTAAHQMHTPQRSLEASRENSYEREEYHLHGDTDPLFYNSQPRTNRIDAWSHLHAQASVESAVSWQTAADWQSAEDTRRPSLERQNTLYDDSCMGYGFEPYSSSTHIRDHSRLTQQPSYEEYYDATGYPYPYEPHWDGFVFEECGLTPNEYQNIINKMPPSSRYSDHNEMAPYRPRPRRTTASLPAQKTSWGETENSAQFSYTITQDENTLISTSAPSKTHSYHIEPTITTKQESYQEYNFQTTTSQFSEKQYNQPYETQNEFYNEEQKPYLKEKTEFNYKDKYDQEYKVDAVVSQSLQTQQTYQYEQFHNQQDNFIEQKYEQHDHLQQYDTAAVAPPNVTQPPSSSVTMTSLGQIPSVTPLTIVTTAESLTTSVPEETTLPSVTSAASTAPTLPRTPSLRRQESIQRPSVRRTRTLPEAPDDYIASSFDESAYDDEYNKTDLDEIDHERTSLDRYHEKDILHDNILESATKKDRSNDELTSNIQKTASPTRTGSVVRKPSVDSYHSQAPSILDRKTSQSSFASHQEDKASIHTTQEESSSEKTKVTFKEDRTKYHEVPDENTFQAQESFDENGSEFHDDQQFTDDDYRDEKFEEPEQFDESQEQYQDEERVEDVMEFEPKQPKLTPKQRWHRAYNKIVMQLN
ncbi:unnamed protein product, partial [Leptidea sinapis]